MEQIITASEFRANQRKYLELAENEVIYITRAGKKPLRISSVSLDEFPTKEELKAIKEGLQEYRDGKTTTIENVNSIWESIL